MKVEQKKEFVPVVITLETEEEVKKLMGELTDARKYINFSPKAVCISLHNKLKSLP